MTYIDSWVEEAHDTVAGEPVSQELLGQLSQVFRSADAADIFKKISGIGIGSKNELTNLFRRVKENGYDLQNVLSNQSLQQYVGRTSPFNID